MIKQYLYKKSKLLFGLVNSYIIKASTNYNASEWWDRFFYTDGVGDNQTISTAKSILSSKYHYCSVELIILRHLHNKGWGTERLSVIDIGSGAGHWIDFYRQLGAKVTGMDVSEKCAENNIDIKHGSALDILPEKGMLHIVNAIGVMFHIVDDEEWGDTIKEVSNTLLPGGLFIVGGHFGLLNGLNVQIDQYNQVNKRLRSKKKWIKTLRQAGFSNIHLYHNKSYLKINDTMPENNILIATKS